VGIEPKRLWAVGLSEYHPVANNTTPRGRGQNRRIEIGLLPEPTGSAE
jgi:flagellar motor protein MotB